MVLFLRFLIPFHYFNLEKGAHPNKKNLVVQKKSLNFENREKVKILAHDVNVEKFLEEREEQLENEKLGTQIKQLDQVQDIYKKLSEEAR